ncbi:MAG: exosortase U [Rubripirellula sp.]
MVDSDNALRAVNAQPYRVPWGLVATASIMLAAHLPLLFRLAQRLWNTDHYQFFPLIVVASLYLGYRYWSESSAAIVPGRRLTRNFLCSGSFFAITIAVLTDSPWMAAISFMITTLACIYMIGGNELIRILLPAWGLLWIAVPLPLGIDEYLIQRLQQTATQWASGLLDLLDYQHFVSGVVVELPKRSFEIEEACSGIHSLFAAVTCAVLYGLLLQRGLLRIAILGLLTVLWVLIVNAARVTAITVLCERWDLPIAEGFGHDLIGAIAFFICMMLVLSTERLLLFAFPYPFKPADYFHLGQKRKVGREKTKSNTNRILPATNRSSNAGKGNGSSLATDVRPPTKSREEVRTLGWLEGYPLAFLATILLFGQFAIVGLLGNVAAGTGALKPLGQTSEEDLPGRIEIWQRTGFEKVTRAADDENGAFSAIWQYQHDNLIGLVSIDGPFVGWHNLGNCLAGQGWAIEETRIETLASPSGNQDLPYVRMSVRKGLGQYAEVFYAVFDGKGAPAKPAETYLAFRAIRRFPKLAELLARFSGTNDASYASADSTTFQVQLFHESTEPPEDEVGDKLLRLFSSAVKTAKTDFLTKDDSNKP